MSKCHNCNGKGTVSGGAVKKETEPLRTSDCAYCSGSGTREESVSLPSFWV